MKPEQNFELLRDWIESIIDEKIEQAFGRNSSLETVKRNRIERQLLNQLVDFNHENTKHR